MSNDPGRNHLLTEDDLEEGVNVEGDTVGFFGADPVDQPAAYTQTYSTAARIVPAATVAAVTLADGVGTNDGAIPAITNNAGTIVAVQELAAQINALAADNLALKKLINALIDDHQELGLCASA